jgi:hypothetical protein
MATVAQLEDALMKADAAGDYTAAREIAAEIKRVRVAPRPQTSRTAAVISGIERGMKPVVDALDYLNPLSYIPFGRQSEQTQRQLGTQGARAQKDRPNYYTGGKIAGEVIATAPVGVGVGTTLRLGGKALTTVAPRVATALEKVGRATVTGGAGVRAPTKTAVATGKNVVAGRGKRMLTRAAAGTLSSVPAAILTDNDILEAAAGGAIIPMLGHIAKFGAGKTFDFLAGRLGEVEAARILRELVSSNADAITKALSNAPAKIKASTAEFLASKGLLTPEIAAVTIKATKGDFSGELLDVAGERAAAQKIVLDRLRGGETQTNAMTNIAANKQRLQDVTGPQREGALTTADVGRTQVLPLEREAARLRQLASEEAENARRLLTANDRSATLIRESGLRLPADIKRQREIVAGLERFGGEAADRSVTAGADARAAEAAAANLRAQGLNPLDISGLVSTLRQKASEAEFVSPDRFKILSEFANNLQRRADKMGGVIDATGLYLARREMGNFVRTILDTTDPKALRQGTAQLVGEAQPLIDDAIEAAGGKGWREYLNTFATGMKDIERQQFQRELTKLPPARFAKVMAGDDADFVEDFFGAGRFDINTELQGPVLATAKKLGRDIDAQLDVKATGLRDLPLSQRLGFAEGARTKVEGMIQPENVFTAGARMLGSVPKIGGGGVAAAQAAERLIEKKSAGVMEKLVPALAQPSRARSLLETRSAEDYVNRLLYGKQSAPPVVAPPRQIPAPVAQDPDLLYFTPPPQSLRAQQAVANRNALSQPQKDIINQNNMAAARQQAVAQTAMRPFNQPSDFEFPEFDPESGDPLIDIDYSEGYPVPIYGKLPKDMRFKSVNSMRR